MKVLICGDRYWTDKISIRSFLETLPKDTIIIQGCCRGADLIAKEEALKLGLKVIDYPADWLTYGNSAGPIRNAQMLKENPDLDLVVAFHPSLPGSKGTKNMVLQAQRANIPTKVIKS